MATQYQEAKRIAAEKAQAARGAGAEPTPEEIVAAYIGMERKVIPGSLDSINAAVPNVGRFYVEIPSRGAGRPEEPLAELARGLHADFGLGQTAIGKLVGREPSTVHRWLNPS